MVWFDIRLSRAHKRRHTAEGSAGAWSPGHLRPHEDITANIAGPGGKHMHVHETSFVSPLSSVQH